MNFERLLVASACLCTAGASCVDLDLSSEYDMELPYYDMNMTVPPLPPSLASYSYATDNALVAVPLECESAFSTKLSAATELNGRPGADDPRKYIRVSEITGGYETLAMMSECAKGLVIGFHGSGGPGWDAVQYAAILANEGFVVVIPDSQAMPDSMGLKGRLPRKATADIVTSNYCGEYLANTGTCTAFNKPYCYSTKVENILHDSTTYRKYVEGVYRIRKREMDYLFGEMDFFANFSSVFAVGNSEGGMVLARYHHPKFDQVLSGRIIDSWSCEFNYYTACEEKAKVCEDSCDKSIPVLNMIGDLDEYFGALNTSVASQVKNSPDGYGAETLQGHCRKALDDQGFTDATVIVVEGAYHGPKYYNDNVVRAAVSDFVNGNKPGYTGSLDACTLTGGVHTCPMDGPYTCKTIDSVYQLNPKATEPMEGVYVPATTTTEARMAAGDTSAAFGRTLSIETLALMCSAVSFFFM